MYSNKIKISVVIPHMETLFEIEDVLNECVNSLINQVDEIIVERNRGIGYGRAVNRGLKKTTGTHIIIANNDTKLIDGELINLCGTGLTITTPNIIPIPRDNLPRSFFCVTRELYNYLIENDNFFFDERFQKGYFEDDDLIKRLQNINTTFTFQPNVIISHLNGGGLTMKQVGEQKYFDINKQKFEEKWKIK